MEPLRGIWNWFKAGGYGWWNRSAVYWYGERLVVMVDGTAPRYETQHGFSEPRSGSTNHRL